MIATSGFLAALECTKSFSLRTPLGELTALPQTRSLAGLRGTILLSGRRVNAPLPNANSWMRPCMQYTTHYDGARTVNIGLFHVWESLVGTYYHAHYNANWLRRARTG